MQPNGAAALLFSRQEAHAILRPRQNARGFLGGAGHRRIVAHQVLRDRAVNEQGELGRERVCIGDVKLFQEIAEPRGGGSP